MTSALTFSAEKVGFRKASNAREARNSAQLDLDFTSAGGYSYSSRKENEPMHNELFEALDRKVDILLEKHAALKDENILLAEENQKLLSEREGLKLRIDSILSKLEGI